MTRKKKGRKVGSEGPAQYTEKNLSKTDILALAKKRSDKRKGNKAGTRHSVASNKAPAKVKASQDPRIGSKKPIPLIVEQKPHPKSNAAKRERRLSAMEELSQLENDAKLNVLLDRIEQGDKLGAGLQSYVDEKLDRIEELMSKLGLLEPEAHETQIRSTSPKKGQTDDELLAQFENFKFNQE